MPSVESIKDKLLQVVSKICNKVGLESVSKACQTGAVVEGKPNPQIGAEVREHAERIGEGSRQQNIRDRPERVVERRQSVVKDTGGRGS